MAKSEWETVKSTKKTKEVMTQKTKKPVAKIESSPIMSSSKPSEKPKAEKKKSTTAKVTRKLFDVKDSDIDKMGGCGTGILANLNCLNVLTSEFTGPERIPAYEKEGAEFPTSKLSIKAKERVDQILSSLPDSEARQQFRKILTNNLIAAARQAENAWGARVMGQMMMKKYPELAISTSDILGPETHPGSVLSVIWLYTQVKEFEQLMSALFWLVLPRLKQKKVAEYLPKVLGDIEQTLKSGKGIEFSKSHIAHLVFLLDDPKLPKTVMAHLKTFFNSIRSKIEPDHTWIESFLPLLSSISKQYALPIILKSIEKDPARAAQELKRLSEHHRLLVDLILQSCPITTLPEKYRDIIASKLHEPMETSSHIKKQNKSKNETAKTRENIHPLQCSSTGCFLPALFKRILYLSLIFCAMSQCESTRPTYTKYAQPYVIQYVEPVINKYLMPNYDEFLKPHVDMYVVPSYNTHMAHHVKSIKDAWNQHVSPVLSTKLAQLQKFYVVNMEPKVNDFMKKLSPVTKKIKEDLVKMYFIAKEKTSSLSSGWESKADDLLKEFRSYVAVAGMELRRFIDTAAIKVKELYSRGIESLQSSTVNLQSQSRVLLKNSKVSVASGFNIILEKMSSITQQTLEVSSIYAERVWVQTADQRAKISDGVSWVAVKASDYHISDHLGNGFEFFGRFVLWTGDCLAELAGMNWCCLKTRFVKLGNNAYDIGNDVYDKLTQK